jgi:hypothetical protein
MNKTSTPRAVFVLCVCNDGYPASLEVRKLYVAIPDRSARTADLIRVIDESGEDYLYPTGYFVTCPLPARVRQALLRRRGGRPATRTGTTRTRPVRVLAGK